MLCGLVIDSTVIGGPAYNSRLLERDDAILRVDGTVATQVAYPGSHLFQHSACLSHRRRQSR
jgi:hypothetical protein